MEKTKEAKVPERESLPVLTRNLLRIAIYNISYIRGLFPEKYFNDKSVLALEMKIKKLMLMDAESRRLIDLTEKGVYDALQKKYLNTLLFCIREKEEGPMIEEYAFSFSYPNTNGEEVAMNMSRTGSKKNSATFKSNAAEVTPDQMRSSACKTIRTLVSLMRILDQMPEEPEDYEPPFFKGCAENEAVNIWNKNPLKMEVGNVNSKHLVLALKVKSVLDPCDANDANNDDDKISVGHESYQDDFMDTEVHPSEVDRYVVAHNDVNGKGQSGTNSEDETQDAAHEEELTAQVRAWISSKDKFTVNASDILSNYPDISLEMVEDILERLLKDGLLSRAGKDDYAVNKVADPKTPYIKKEVAIHNVSLVEETKNNDGDLIYMKELYNVTIAKLQGKHDDEANQSTVRKLIDKMVQDGLGKSAVHLEVNNKIFLQAAPGSVPSKSSNAPVSGKECSNIRATSDRSRRKKNIDASSSGNGEDPNRGDARNLSSNDAIRLSRVIVRRLADLNALDPSQVTVVLSAEDSVEDRIALAREGRRRGFHFANNQAFRQICLRMFMDENMAMEAAADDFGDPDYEAAGDDGHEAEEEGAQGEEEVNEHQDGVAVQQDLGDGQDEENAKEEEEVKEQEGELSGQPEGYVENEPQVAVRRLADFNALDPSQVTVVLSAEDSVENRITLAREGRRRGFHFANNQAFRQICLRMFMDENMAMEAAADDFGDPDYEAAEDLAAGQDGHDEEEEGELDEAVGLQPEEGEDEDQEEDGEEDEEQEEDEEAALPSTDNEAENDWSPSDDDDWSLIEHVEIDDVRDIDQPAHGEQNEVAGQQVGDEEEVVLRQEEGEDEDEEEDAEEDQGHGEDEDDWSLIDDPDYSPSSGVESDGSGPTDFCDDSWLWFPSESDSETNDDDSDYHPSDSD